MQDKNSLIETTFSGIYYTDNLEFHYKKYDRKFDVKTTYMGITRASDKFETKSTGFLGIQPWSADPNNKDKSFLWNLKSLGLIDHEVVSLYVTEEKDSVIKFGSYDKKALIKGLYSSNM